MMCHLKRLDRYNEELFALYRQHIEADQFQACKFIEHRHSLDPPPPLWPRPFTKIIISPLFSQYWRVWSLHKAVKLFHFPAPRRIRNSIIANVWKLYLSSHLKRKRSNIVHSFLVCPIPNCKFKQRLQDEVIVSRDYSRASRTLPSVRASRCTACFLEINKLQQAAKLLFRNFRQRYRREISRQTIPCVQR